MNTKTTDVLVIGAGPIGLACGVEASRRGLSCRIEEHYLNGRH